MMDKFETAELQTGETSIFVRWSGSGLPILMLHGFPQTHLMWRSVAPLLARNFTVVCADLRGYGRSGCPASAPDHAPYAKRAMAQDMVIVMERLVLPGDATSSLLVLHLTEDRDHRTARIASRASTVTGPALD